MLFEYSQFGPFNSASHPAAVGTSVGCRARRKPRRRRMGGRAVSISTVYRRGRRGRSDLGNRELLRKGNFEGDRKFDGWVLAGGHLWGTGGRAGTGQRAPRPCMHALLCSRWNRPDAGCAGAGLTYRQRCQLSEWACRPSFEFLPAAPPPAAAAASVAPSPAAVAPWSTASCAGQTSGCEGLGCQPFGRGIA